MARGGKRSGTPGKSYPNRSDLHQPVRVVTGQAYGQAQAMENAQRAIPLPNNAAVPVAAPPVAPASAGAPGPSAPPMPFMRPTERPDEPVTAGQPSGPGPGSEVLTTIGSQAPDVVGAQLRAVYAQFPNDDLLRVMALHEQR